MIILKDEPELRHVIAHMFEAIRMASKGDEAATLYEINSIEGLVLFDGDDDFRRYVDGLQRQNETETKETNQT